MAITPPKQFRYLVCEIIRNVAGELAGPAAVLAFSQASMREGVVKMITPTPEDAVYYYQASGAGCSINGHVAVRHGSRQMVVTVTEWMVRGGERHATHFTRIVEHDEPINLPQ